MEEQEKVTERETDKEREWERDIEREIKSEKGFFNKVNNTFKFSIIN